MIREHILPNTSQPISGTARMENAASVLASLSAKVEETEINTPPTAILTKRVQFEAAHDLPGHQGKCARLHGHSYTLEVSLRGPIKDAPGESDDGMVMDFQNLSEIIQRAVLTRIDHRYLNEIVGRRTTAENLVHWMWDALIQEGLEASLLYRLRLWETATSCVEITQEERASTQGLKSTTC